MSKLLSSPWPVQMPLGALHHLHPTASTPRAPQAPIGGAAVGLSGQGWGCCPRLCSGAGGSSAAITAIVSWLVIACSWEGGSCSRAGRALAGANGSKVANGAGQCCQTKEDTSPACGVRGGRGGNSQSPEENKGWPGPCHATPHAVALGNTRVQHWLRMLPPAPVRGLLAGSLPQCCLRRPPGSIPARESTALRAPLCPSAAPCKTRAPRRRVRT